MSGKIRFGNRDVKAVWQIIRPLVFGVVSGCAAAAVLLYAAAFLIVMQNTVPASMLSGITTVILCAAALAGGAIAAVTAGKGGLLYGIGCGVLLSIVVLVCSLSLYGTGNPAAAASKFAMMILCGAVAGIVTVNRKSKIKF